MRSHSLSLRRLAPWMLLLSFATAPAFGQQAPALDGRSEPIRGNRIRVLERPGSLLQELLQTGRQLEQHRRWGEALLHYEQAVKEHPGQADLEQRLSLSRMHYDLARRYADRSFTDQLLNLQPREALDLYGEVLLKIHSHYVHPPEWQKLVEQGRTGLDVALTESAFRDQHVPAEQHERIDAFRRDLPRLIAGWHIRDRHEARAAVWGAAQHAAKSLQMEVTPVILEFLCGATGSLDLYSSFLTGAQLEDVFSQIEGNFVGLGVEVKVKPDALQIVHVIEGGPAAEAGIRPLDQIVEVDGETISTVSTEALADLLKGVEGSKIRVVIETPQRIRRAMNLTRRRVEVPSVEDVHIVDRNLGVGYLRLSSFQKTTSKDVDAALWKLHREGMQHLVLDVRGNPGGLLPAAVEVADKFVKEGTIVSTRGRSQRENFNYRAHQAGTWRVPLIVLIDGDSASASEIFAGAIHDHGRGAILGEKSYGKGSVQGIFPLTITKAGIRLTTAKFYSPNGTPISMRGVTPNVPVQITAKPAGNGPVVAGDVTLEKAVQLVREQMASRLGSR